ncbi:hypothetical protein AAVH_10986 [Aphelenchoides avenae]|nr:hypothetical protein AAVH_10986 [Aphelenchus avenae]
MAIVVKCVCSDDDLCNKRRSFVDKNLVDMFKKARPCETHTVYEHLLWRADTYKKPNTSKTEGHMCPIFYNFAHPGRPNAFLLFRQDGCHLVEATISESGNCTDKLFGDHDQPLREGLLILLCNPLGEHRTPYPDAELKKTIGANLTAAKAEFPTCTNGSWSLDFVSVSELVMDNSKLEHMFNDIPNGTNDNITTPHCYVEVSFVYQQQYNFTFGAVSIDDKPLHDACHDSENFGKCVRWNSAARDEDRHFACCCRRHWSKAQNMCPEGLLGQLKILLNENAIAREPTDIMSELKRDPLRKCDEAKKANEGHTDTDVNRPCARNEGCYTGVHARDVRTSTQHKKVEFAGCVSKDAPDAKKRADEASDEVEARFYRICRLPINEGQCFAVIGTEDPELPDDVKGPQMVCCCKGRVGTTKKCGSSHKLGAKIGDLV